MAETKDLIGRLGLLGLSMLLCILKYLYTFTLELHSTGGEAAYVLIVHDAYVIAGGWTVLLAVLVMTTGAAKIDDMGKLRFLHSSYFTVMAGIAAFSIFNDAVAMGHAIGAHNWILLAQFALEVLVLVLMGQQLWAAVKAIGSGAYDAAHRGLGDD